MSKIGYGALVSIGVVFVGYTMAAMLRVNVLGVMFGMIVGVVATTAGNIVMRSIEDADEEETNESSKAN